MKIEINFTNKWLYSLIAIVVVLGLGVGVYAYVYTNPIPSPGHSGDTIWVDVGDGREMNLQKAIFDGEIGGIGGAVSIESATETFVYNGAHELVVTCKSGKRIGCSGGVSSCIYDAIISPIDSPAESCKLIANCNNLVEVYAYCLG